LTDYYKGI